MIMMDTKIKEVTGKVEWTAGEILTYPNPIAYYVVKLVNCKSNNQLQLDQNLKVVLSLFC